MTHRSCVTLLGTIVLLSSVSVCLSGCTSLYHITLEEMRLSEIEVLAARVDETRENHISAQRAFERSVSRLVSAPEPGGDENGPQHSMANLLDRFRLETWNLGRRIASVRDAGASFFAAHHQPTLHEKYLLMLASMETAHVGMQRMVEGVQHHHALHQAGIAPHEVSMFRAVPDPEREADSIAAQVQAAIDDADAFLDLLDGLHQ